MSPNTTEALKEGFFFHPGEDVLVRGSEAKAEPNGQAGKVVSYVLERGMYKVRVGGNEILVEEGNLALSHPEWRHEYNQVHTKRSSVHPRSSAESFKVD